MRKTSDIIIAIFLSTLFSLSCQNQSRSEIKETFHLIKAAISSGDLPTFETMLDKESLLFLDKLQQLMKNENFAGITKLADRFESRFTVYLLYQEYLQFTKKEDELKDAPERALPPSNSLFALLGLGILNSSATEDYIFLEVNKIRRNEATIKIKRNTGVKNQFIISECKFSREEDEWKLNLMSTFTMEENLLSQLHKKSGLEEMTFINDLINYGTGPLRFRY